MQDFIQTSNLGPVSISKHVIRCFFQEQTDGDEAIATNEAIQILQSTEIDQLVTPVPSSELEFWVHRSSSLVFTVLPKGDYKHVSMVLKQDMSNFEFDNE
jgi:hypothetical protein